MQSDVLELLLSNDVWLPDYGVRLRGLKPQYWCILYDSMRVTYAIDVFFVYLDGLVSFSDNQSTATAIEGWAENASLAVEGT